MVDLQDFQRKQLEFAACIRDPNREPCPKDVDERHMAVYRELFFNNIEDFLANTFPVLSELLGELCWQEMMRDFYLRHHASTPLFPALPGEFVRYLEETRVPGKDDLPFQNELAHYEWMEMVAAQSDARLAGSNLDPDGDLLQGRPFVSPLVWVLKYDYPVHRIGPNYQPQTPDETSTWLVVYRDSDEEVRFVEINAATARLLQLLDSGEGLTGKEALIEVARDIDFPEPNTILEHGKEILANLKECGIIAGTRTDR